MQEILEISRNFINCNNFSKYSLIFAFSIILAENKYIFTYLIRISIKMTQNKYTYQKKVSRRNPGFAEDATLQLSKVARLKEAAKKIVLKFYHKNIPLSYLRALQNRFFILAGKSVDMKRCGLRICSLYNLFLAHSNPEAVHFINNWTISSSSRPP